WIDVRGERGAIAETLSAVPGVKEIQARTGEAGAQAFEIEAEAGRDLRGDIARAVVQKGHELIGLKQTGMSLEEIFLHLTTSVDETPVTAAPQMEVRA
ncbi:MAG: hypothetical protein MUF51_04660, partial [Vicinamibacteria bacterium]|nr:hypothetical protein [Vicinamibacteria bacterium]